MGNDETSRRSALKVVAGVCTCALGGALAAPAAVFLAGPVDRSAKNDARWIKTVRLTALSDGAPTKVAIVSDLTDAYTIKKNVELGAAWVVRRGDKVAAFSVVCPHLGCSVNPVPSGGFACPCHTSSFGPDGKKEGGPAPRGLDELATRIEDEHVWIDFRKFRIGTAEKIQVG